MRIKINSRIAKEEYKMTEQKANMPLGTWDKLATTETEIKPKVSFNVNEPVNVVMYCDGPREFQGDTGAYYGFDVMHNNEEKIILTSAWSLLRELKKHSPLMNKKLTIIKKTLKGKQYFEVTELKED